MYSSRTCTWTLEIDNDTPTDNSENVPNEGNDSIFDEIPIDHNKYILKLEGKSS